MMIQVPNKTLETARELLKSRNLRVTRSRIAVLDALLNAKRPLSCVEVREQLQGEGCDPATVYRNLIKFVSVQIASVVSRVDGIAHYRLNSSDQEAHHHPHFVCNDCGEIACLPDSITESLGDSLSVEGPWANAVRLAQVQLRGECPDCTIK